ncbi:MAG: hypothetical protein ACRDDJ_08760 [[Mycobacterium] stephanolepidis]
MKTATLTQSRRTRCAHHLTAEERSILNAAPAQQPSVPIEAVPAYLRGEWEHFKGFGWSDHRIAERLGIQGDTVKKWPARHAERIARSQEIARRQIEAENSTLTTGHTARDLEALIGAAPLRGAHPPAIAQAIAC